MKKMFLPLLFSLGLLAQPGGPRPVTRVLATLTLSPGVDREQLMKILPQEVKDTVQLHLDGKIDQWFARADGKGVVFLVNCRSVDEARAALEGLPLIREKMATFEYMALGPLAPLRVLLGGAGK